MSNSTNGIGPGCFDL